MTQEKTQPTAQRTLDTQLTHAGREPARFAGAVNPPVFRASTIISPTMELFESGSQRRFSGRDVVYGRFGTPTTQAFESAVAEIEGGDGSFALPSGLAAITATLLALVESGDHLLMPDSVYFPVRKFCDGALKRLGVRTTYYPPRIGAGIAGLIEERTRVVYLESPGSLTFEIQDIPAITEAARAKGAVTVADNTWATPLFCRPLVLGADISIQAATKYIVGHADAMLGVVVFREAMARKLRENIQALGNAAGSEELYLGLRGLRSLGPRLRQHQETGFILARWLEERPEVASVLHPGLEQHPDHALWKRDFSGASGLFSIVLSQPYPRSAVAAMLDGFSLFGMGSSWGGFESLMIPSYPERFRDPATWTKTEGPVLRLHAGLEDPADLLTDLEAGFQRLAAAAGAGA